MEYLVIDDPVQGVYIALISSVLELKISECSERSRIVFGGNWGTCWAFSHWYEDFKNGVI